MDEGEVFRTCRTLVVGGGSYSPSELIAALSNMGINARLAAPAPSPVETPPVAPLSPADLSRIRAAEEKRARRAARRR